MSETKHTPGPVVLTASQARAAALEEVERWAVERENGTYAEMEGARGMVVAILSERIQAFRELRLHLKRIRALKPAPTLPPGVRPCGRCGGPTSRGVGVQASQLFCDVDGCSWSEALRGKEGG